MRFMRNRCFRRWSEAWGLLAFLLVTDALAQPVNDAVLRGSVVSRGVVHPVSGAHLLVDGIECAKTDADGAFTCDVAAGEHALEIAAPGYVNDKQQVVVASGEAVELLVRLTPEDINPYETTVTAKRPFEELSRTTLSRRELRETPGGMGDPIRAVMRQPGIASVGQAVAYPVVRGTQPSATTYEIDGVRVPLLFHLGLGPAVVSSEMVEALDYTPGVAGASNGRLTGGLLSARIARPKEDRFRATVWADLLQSGFYLEAPFPSTGTTVVAAARLSYSSLLLSLGATVLSRFEDGQRPPDEDPHNESLFANFTDYQLRVEQRLGPGKLRLFVFGATDVVGTSSEHPQSFDGRVSLGFHRADLRWEQPAAGGRFEFAVTGGQESLGLITSRGTRQIAEVSADQWSGGARIGWQRSWSDTFSLRTGADVEKRRAGLLFDGLSRPVGARGIDPLDAFRRPETSALVAGVYLETSWMPSTRWTLTSGVRTDVWNDAEVAPLVGVDPRLGAKLAIRPDLTLRAGTGLFHQPASLLLPVPVAETAGLPLGLQRVMQNEIGATWSPTPEWELDVAVFGNLLLRTVEPEFTRILENRIPPGEEGPDPASHGRSYGAEFSVRRALGGHWYGSASYTWQRSERWSIWDRFSPSGEKLGTATGWLPFAFEQRHVFNASATGRFGKGWSLGAGLHLNTGRPESGQLSSIPRVPWVDEEGHAGWSRVDIDRADRLPAYVRLDLRVSKTWVYDEHLLELYLDLYNASITREVVGWNYYDYPRGNGDDVGEHGREAFDLGRLVVPMLGLRGQW